MTTCTIRGIPVSFPFEPYTLQKEYMEKVMDCLQNESNGILESPTGTGKTLSLLCSSLAWLSLKKAQIKLQMQSADLCEANDFIKDLHNELNEKVGGSSNSNVSKAFFHLPTIIYASRTHSQLTQAMQELKRTAYSHMKATVIGSREQMCIHPDIIKETNNAAKVNMCRLKVTNRLCHFYNNVERRKCDPIVKGLNVTDIEDLITLGRKHKFCPYYMSRELKHDSDIVFMPYNYLLDPKARRALGIELSNNIIILDEAHNIDKICEDSASIQIKSTDVAMCIEDVTQIMKAMERDSFAFLDENIPKDFSEKELCDMKEILLNLEKAIDDIEIKRDSDMTTFEGNYIFEILQKAGINDNNFGTVSHTIDKMIQFLAAVNEGPFQSRGNALQMLADLLLIVFTSTSHEFREKMQKCYKVHIDEEEPRKKTVDTWLTTIASKKCRVLSYWCFNPGFGMNSLMRKGVKCVILTSGTLAPLQPLVSELDIKVDVRLENPHIVTKDQIFIRIISKGPDNEPLNCSYHNRSNRKFISSLGRSIQNFIRMIPDGLLIFLPSYPILRQCQEQWQQEGIWSHISSIKTIYVEPRDKESFSLAMSEYYTKIKDPNSKGAIFMGVCRGKISEGLDFADINGRAVIIIGLPYPPMKDPKIILKKRYLDVRHASNKQYLKGDDWYSLEATRAVNQAIGRVIRHKDDYGAILLLDARFENIRIRSQMSLWLRDRIEVVSAFGSVLRGMKLFFQKAEAMFPVPKENSKNPDEESKTLSVPAEFDVSNVYKQNLFQFGPMQPSEQIAGSSSNLVTIHKRNPNNILQNVSKKKKITIIPRNTSENTNEGVNMSTKDYIIMVQKALEPQDFKTFLEAMKAYHHNSNFSDLTQVLDVIFSTKPHLHYIIRGLSNYIKAGHEAMFEGYWSKFR